MNGALHLAEAKDLAASARLFAAMYSRPNAEMTVDDALRRLATMQAGPWRVTELRLDGKPAGFALWVDLVEYVFLRSFSVDPKRRRDGLGRTFFAAMQSSVWPDGRQIRLEVAKGGPWAFWEKLDFKPVTTGMWHFEEGGS